MAPKFSIIIPTFNSSQTILRCLESIQRQTFGNYEVLIQDGGSSDGTVELVAAFCEMYQNVPVRIVQQPDTGVYDAMNKARSVADGDWLYFLGSDDEFFDQDVLSAVAELPELGVCDVVYGNVYMVGNGVLPTVERYDGEFNKEKLLSKNICHQAIFYRSRFLDSMGDYDLRYPAWSDWDMNLRCWTKTRFSYVDLTIAAHHLGGISTKGDERFMSDVARNVLGYFTLSAFDPIVDSSEFIGNRDIPKLQLAENPVRFHARRLYRGLLRRIGSLRRVQCSA